MESQELEKSGNFTWDEGKCWTVDAGVKDITVLEWKCKAVHEEGKQLVAEKRAAEQIRVLENKKSKIIQQQLKHRS